MTNQEWLATLKPEEWWKTIERMLRYYSRGYIDTRLAVTKWLQEEHKD